MLRGAFTVIVVAALAMGPIAGRPVLAKPAKTKYAKSEIDKANSACAIMLLLGIGASAIGGKKTAKYALPVTVLACIVIQASARHKEKILAAQRETLNAPRKNWQETFPDSSGQDITFSGSGSSDQLVDGARLQPVKYKTIDGQEAASPVMDTGGKTCRTVTSSLSYRDGRSALLPAQVFCRTTEGDWEPYAVQTA